MKLIIYRPDGPPIEIESERFRVEHGDDVFEIRPVGGALLVRIEEHREELALDLAVFPHGGNSIALKGGLRR